MSKAMIGLFSKHLASVDESYLEHFKFAFGFSIKLGLAAMAACIHAFLPFLFEKTAGNITRDLLHKIDNRS